MTGGNGNGAFGLLGEGEHLGDQQVVLERQRLKLAREDHRNAQLEAGHHRRSDARGLDGDDLADALAGETLGELVADLLHQARIDLVVEKGVHLEYVLGQHDAFAANLLFQRLHGRSSG